MIGLSASLKNIPANAPQSGDMVPSGFDELQERDALLLAGAVVVLTERPARGARCPFRNRA